MIGYRQLQIAYSGTHDFKRGEWKWLMREIPFFKHRVQQHRRQNLAAVFGLRQLENTYV
jgi:hypothetical protein